MVTLGPADTRDTGPAVTLVGEDADLAALQRAIRSHGVERLFVKELSANDNSKNQPYLGGSLATLNVLPFGELHEETSDKGETRLKATLPLEWLRPDGTLTSAPNAQLILYPQYPEIRLSGFLKGTQGGPNDLMTVRQRGRMLFLGVTNDRRIVGYVAGHESRLAKEVRSLRDLERTGVLLHLPTSGTSDPSREMLVDRLRAIHEMGWLGSQRLTSGGHLGPCSGSNCGGYTLEAMFGIIPNGRAEPDFSGWELKAHLITRFGAPPTGQLTLMTPEPTGGYYKKSGPEAFVKRFGYPDGSGVADRLNFSSPHRFGVQNAKTGLTLNFIGYSPGDKKFDPSGGFGLFDKAGGEAAVWHFSGLIEHWKRKHAKAAYVPYVGRGIRSRESDGEQRQYAYGRNVRLCEKTDFLRFLDAVASGKIYYDPGIKVENASAARPVVKRRSQFRIRSKDVGTLYENVEAKDVCGA